MYDHIRYSRRIGPVHHTVVTLTVIGGNHSSIESSPGAGTVCAIYPSSRHTAVERRRSQSGVPAAEASRWSPPRGRLRPPLAGAELDRLRGARSLGDALARRLVRRRGVGRARGSAARLARTARRLGAVGGADARRGAPRRGLCRGACSESTNKVRSLGLFIGGGDPT